MKDVFKVFVVTVHKMREKKTSTYGTLRSFKNKINYKKVDPKGTKQIKKEYFLGEDWREEEKKSCNTFVIHNKKLRGNEHINQAYCTVWVDYNNET